MRKALIPLLLAITIASSAWALDEKVIPSTPKASPAGEGPAAALANAESTYEIGIGDVLGISVWKDDALTKETVVLPDGVISFPLLGLLKAGAKRSDSSRQSWKSASPSMCRTRCSTWKSSRSTA